ncbi:MAG: carbohydrate ABC transporter permease [Anaerolineales bacterium]|nr:carbohydrate ABC transporter permease [Anaerolineales bacterium]
MQALTKSRYGRLNLLTTAVLLIIGLVWIYPFLWVIFASFKTPSEMFRAGATLLPETWDFSNFSRAWFKANFNIYFFNTIVYAVSATVIEVIKSSMCGYVLGRYDFPGRRLLMGLILATLFIPIASIILPQFQLIRTLGLLNTRPGVILAMSGGAGALYVLLFTGFFQTLPDELFDSARIDGAGFLTTFRLMLPLAKPIIGTVVIFQFMNAWNEFNIPLVFTLGKPELRNMAVGMYAFRGEYSVDWPGFAAGTAISIIPVLLVFFAFQGYFVRGLSGAVKQ